VPGFLSFFLVLFSDESGLVFDSSPYPAHPHNKETLRDKCE